MLCKCFFFHFFLSFLPIDLAPLYTLLTPRRPSAAPCLPPLIVVSYILYCTNFASQLLCSIFRLTYRTIRFNYWTSRRLCPPVGGKYSYHYLCSFRGSGFYAEAYSTAYASLLKPRLSLRSSISSPVCHFSTKGNSTSFPFQVLVSTRVNYYSLQPLFSSTLISDQKFLEQTFSSNPEGQPVAINS